jgi:hypothetical protein
MLKVHQRKGEEQGAGLSIELTGHKQRKARKESFPKTSSVPSHPLSTPALTFPSHSSPTCHQTTPPSYTIITLWLTYYTNFTQPQPPAIPNTSTFYYNNRNIPNTYKDHKKQQPPHCCPHSPIPLPASTFSATLSKFLQISIVSLQMLNPQLLLILYNI